MPVNTEADFILDPGSIIIALALQRGDLAHHVTWESVLQGTETQLAWHPDRLSKPLLQAGRPAGVGLDADKPLRADAIRALLCKLCLILGFGGICLKLFEFVQC